MCVCVYIYLYSIHECKCIGMQLCTHNDTNGKTEVKQSEGDVRESIPATGCLRDTTKPSKMTTRNLDKSKRTRRGCHASHVPGQQSSRKASQD